jgi:hypothetical protein
MHQALQKMKPSTIQTPALQVGTYGFGSKAAHPILQAADLLAFSSLQHLRDGKSALFDKLRLRSRTKYRLFHCDGWVIDKMKGHVGEYFELRKKGLVEKLH